MPVTLTDEEISQVSFAISCYLDDYEKTIKREEKRQGKRLEAARDQHSSLSKLQVTKIKPSILCGDLELMNGEIVKKG